MKSVKVAVVLSVGVAVASAALAPASYGRTPNWGFEALLYASFPTSGTTTPLMSSESTVPGYVSPLLARETAVLTRQGLSPARASEAIDVRSEIAQAGIVGKVQKAMGNAFGGVWFEPAAAKLHIGVTSRASRQEVEMLVAQEDLTAGVTETPVRSTWAQLTAAQKRWNRRLSTLFSRADVETALDATMNAVSVKLSSSVPSEVRALLEREALRSAVNVIVTVMPQPKVGVATEAKETKCDKNAETKKAACEPPITAGVTIESEEGSPKEICTAGPLAFSPTERTKMYVLTVGHCIDEREGKWNAYNLKGEKKEIGDSADGLVGAEGDYGEIEIENGFWKSGVANNPVFALTARWKAGAAGEKSYPVVGKEEPVEGSPNCHEGEETGESCGKVGNTKVTAEILGIDVENLVEDRESISAKGDSGGPWFFVSKNGIMMEGTHVGKNKAGTNPVYMPLKKTLEKLKLELLTTANEVIPCA